MLTIGKLGDAAGVKVPTIRYYEQIGLLPEPDRSSGNQRLYARRTLDRLSFIRHARELGFPLKALETELERMIVQCAHGTIADCRVIEVLGDHANCAHDHHGGQEAAL